MSVPAVDSFTYHRVASAASDSYTSYAVSSNNPGAFLAVETSTSGANPTATFNGVSLTAVGSSQRQGTANLWLWLFKLPAPSSGAHTVSISVSGGNQVIASQFIGFTSANQTDPLHTSGAFGGDGQGAKTVTLTSTIDNCLMALADIGSVDNYTAGTGSSNISGAVGDIDSFVGSSVQTPAGAYSMTISAVHSTNHLGIQYWMVAPLAVSFIPRANPLPQQAVNRASIY